MRRVRKHWTRWAAAEATTYVLQQPSLRGSTQGRRMLRGDARKVGNVVAAPVSFARWPTRFDALRSFTSTVSAANLRRSQLLRRIIAGDHDDRTQELAQWLQVGGRGRTGLVKRGPAEGVVFRSGSYSRQTRPLPAR